MYAAGGVGRLADGRHHKQTAAPSGLLRLTRSHDVALLLLLLLCCQLLEEPECVTVSSLTSDQKYDPIEPAFESLATPTLHLHYPSTPSLNARPGGIPLMLLLARVGGGGGDDDHDRDHPESKQGASFLGGIFLEDSLGGVFRPARADPPPQPL